MDKMIFESKRALIFDIDGTLWDATEQLCEVWNNVIRSLGIERRLTAGEVRSIMGKTIEETSEIFFSDFPKEQGLSIMRKCAEEQIGYLARHGARLYDGVSETLKALSATYDLYIVSNCPVGYVEAFVNSSHLTDIFMDYEMSGRTGKSKGENISLLMSRDHLSNCIYIGDTQGDEQTARTADIPFIHAAYGFGTAAHPDATIHDFRELTSLIPYCPLLR